MIESLKIIVNYSVMLLFTGFFFGIGLGAAFKLWDIGCNMVLFMQKDKVEEDG